MTQGSRRETPLYSCIVSVESLTGRSGEEVMAFGASPGEAQQNAEDSLRRTYEFDEAQVRELLNQATVKLMNPWCAAPSPDTDSQ